MASRRHAGLTLLALALTALPVEAQPELRRGPTAFGTALQLLRAAPSFNSVYFYPSTWQFTVFIPPTAVQSLARLTIDLPEQFGAFGVQLPDLRNIKVFVPTDPQALRPQDPEQMLPAQVTLQGRTVVVDFDPPVPAGQTVTVSIEQVRNPRSPGNYLFEVSAYPEGPGPIKQFVGFGRFTFRESGRFFP
jgi:hypothetical protein